MKWYEKLQLFKTIVVIITKSKYGQIDTGNASHIAASVK